MNNRLFWMLLSVGMLAFQIGCGDGLSSLQGKVTIDGQPAGAGVALQFQPVGTGSPSYAETDADGNYVAQFTHRKAGIQPGEHRVSLVPGGGGGAAMEQIPEVIDGEVQRQAVPSAEQANQKAKLPSRYYTEITKITVEPGSNSIDIALETE